jgi:Protein of unknown function (DUF3800)
VLNWDIYVDESYTNTNESPSVLVIGGYLFSKEAAEQLTVEWSAVLEENGIRYFHMEEFAPRPPKKLYRHLTTESLDALGMAIFGIVKTRVTAGFAVAANTNRSWNFPPHPNDPYAFAFDQFVGSVADHVRQIDANSLCRFILEKGDSRGDDAIRLLRQKAKLSNDEILRNAEVNYGIKEKCCPLQAADIIAWQFRKFVVDRVNCPTRKLRKDFRSLLEARRHEFSLFFTNGMKAQKSFFMEPWILEEGDLYRAHLQKLFNYGFGPPDGERPPGFDHGFRLRLYQIDFGDGSPTLKLRVS